MNVLKTFFELLTISVFSLLALSCGKSSISCEFSDGHCQYPNDYQPPSLTLSYPKATRNFYLNDDTSIRTVAITHGGTSLECSSDGGTTFQSCDSGTTFIWDASNYNTIHVVRSTTIGGGSSSVEFTPSIETAGLSFGACDVEVNSNSSFSVLDSLLAGNTIVCLANGVTVSTDATTTLTMNANNKLLVREGESATISSATNNDLIDITNVNNVGLYGLTINATGTGQVSIHVQGTSDGTQMWDLNVNSTTTTNAAIKLTSNTPATSTTINNSTISHTNTTSSNAIYATNSDLVINSSTLSSGYTAFYAFNNGSAPTISISNSSISTSNTTQPALSVRSNVNSYSLNLDGNIVTSSGGGGLILQDAAGSAISKLEGNTFKRAAVVSSDSVALQNENSNSSNQFNSSLNNNLFCNLDNSLTNGVFSSILATTHSGSFTAAGQNAHTNATDISGCP